MFLALFSKLLGAQPLDLQSAFFCFFLDFSVAAQRQPQVRVSLCSLILLRSALNVMKNKPNLTLPFSASLLFRSVATACRAHSLHLSE